MTVQAFDPWAALKSQHEAQPPPKAASSPKPPWPEPAGLAALAGLGGRHPAPAQLHEGGVPPLPGVPPAWREGVALLATLPVPDGIMPRRWAAYTATAARLLHDDGAELHAAGWNALDLFGLHPTAPMTHPAG